jgi:hypothetical protein
MTVMKSIYFMHLKMVNCKEYQNIWGWTEFSGDTNFVVLNYEGIKYQNTQYFLIKGH